MSVSEYVIRDNIKSIMENVKNIHELTIKAYSNAVTNMLISRDYDTKQKYHKIAFKLWLLRQELEHLINDMEELLEELQ